MNKEGEKPKRRTLGEESLRLSSLSPGTHSVDEQAREQLKGYEPNMLACIKDSKDVYEYDFYIVVLTKKERLLQNVIRQEFFATIDCPTPTYDQAVYKYFKKDRRIELLWVIPNVHAVNFMKNNAHLVKADKYALLDYVLKFSDGSLLRLAKNLCGECRDSNILEK